MISEEQAGILAIAHNTGLHDPKTYVPKEGNVQATALLILQANEESVNTRYSTTDTTYGDMKTLSIDFPWLLAIHSRLSTVQLIKLVHHTVYQSADYTGWNNSVSCIILDSLQNKLVTRLPGYEEASWGLAL